jgi:hypothetical protein
MEHSLLGNMDHIKAMPPGALYAPDNARLRVNIPLVFEIWPALAKPGFAFATNPVDVDRCGRVFGPNDRFSGIVGECEYLYPNELPCLGIHPRKIDQPINLMIVRYYLRYHERLYPLGIAL